MIYPAPPVRVPSPAPPPLEEVVLDAGGVRVVGWLQAARSGVRPLVVYFHGNAENLETLRQSGLYDEFSRLGADLLAVDYPGYGRSAGAPSESANIAAAEAALAWAVNRRPARLVVAGWSLGAAVAIQLASRHPGEVDRLVLMSPWSSLGELARQHYPAFLVGAFLREGYDSVGAASAVRCPTIVLHGGADSIIPADHGERLARALGGRARLVNIAGAGHNDLLGEPQVWRELGAFVADS